MHEHGVLHDVPVVRRERVLAALVEDGVERVARDVERHRVRAWIERHLVQILERINIRQDAAGGRVVLQVVEHAVHLVEFTLGILVLDAELVAVGLADRAGLVGPLVPNMAVEIMHVIGLLLIDPQDLVHGGLERRTTQRKRGKLLAQVVARRDAKVFNGIGRGAILPHRADLLALGGGAMVQDIAAHGYKLLISFAH